MSARTKCAFPAVLAALHLLCLGILRMPEPILAQEPETGGSGVLALVGVTVLTMDGPRVLPDQTLLIRDGRIEAIGPQDSVAVSEDAEVLELPGRFVLPGLIDMHVHIFSEKELSLYLDAGITSVRNMWGWDLHLELRKAVARGSNIGPRIFTSGRLLDGDPPVLRGSAALSTPEQARAEVDRQKRAGFDGIKVYDRLSPAVFAAVVLAAEQAGLPVWGHPPEAVGVEGALVSGIRTLEHLRGFPGAVGGGDVGWSAAPDPAAIAKLALRVRHASTTIVPTLTVHEASELTASEQRMLFETSAVARIPEPLRSFCCQEIDEPDDDLDIAVRERRRRNRRDVVAALHREGVRLLVGSDTGNPWVIPGTSFHDELQLLHEARLSTFDVLRAATRDAALELNAAAEIGRLAPGLAADLVIVSRNPLEDLDVLRRPDGVLVQGRWHRMPDQ